MISLSKIDKLLKTFRQWELDKVKHTEVSDYFAKVIFVENSKNSLVDFFNVEDNLSLVLNQIKAFNEVYSEEPIDVLKGICHIIEGYQCSRISHQESLFLVDYFKWRFYICNSVRQEFDNLVVLGKISAVKVACVFTEELDSKGFLDDLEDYGEFFEQIMVYWYQEILKGSLNIQTVLTVPREIGSALNHLSTCQQEQKKLISDKDIFQKFYPVFISVQIFSMSKLVVEVEKLGIPFGIKEMSKDSLLDINLLEIFVENFDINEILHRFHSISNWLSDVNTWTNYDGVVLTPQIINYLAQKDTKIEILLERLDYYRAETINGQFIPNNLIQKELEFKHFESFVRNLYRETLGFSYNDWDFHRRDLQLSRFTIPNIYEGFNRLNTLPISKKSKSVEITEIQKNNAFRCAYEAMCFLSFLEKFKSHTSRDIVIIGNERYGRQWVIELIEPYITDWATVKYQYIRSGASMRMTVPHIFPTEFVSKLNHDMPHIIVVDGANRPISNPYSQSSQKNVFMGDDFMRTSRAMRSVANWFAAFNYARSGHKIGEWADNNILPSNRLPELVRWHEFERVIAQISPWIFPGMSYRVMPWAPELKKNVVLGDVIVNRKDQNFFGDIPTVVLANTNIYRDQWNNMPKELEDTKTYYFDGPEGLVKDDLNVGFGKYGFEVRLEGPTTDMFVFEIQKIMRKYNDTNIDNFRFKNGQISI